MRAQHDLFTAYLKYLNAEDAVFQSLSFSADDNLPSPAGQTIKLVLKDPLGRKWIFKPCLSDRFPGTGEPLCCADKFNSITVYRIYKLLGIATPRISFVNLRINGKTLSGALQEYVPNEGVLFKKTVAYLSPEACAYLHKTQVVDWIFANHDANLTNFLVLAYASDISPRYLMRVDNESSLRGIRNYQLRYDTDDPLKIVLNPRDRGRIGSAYYWFWKNYIRGRLDYNVCSSADFISFVRGFPEEYIQKILFYQCARPPVLSGENRGFGAYIRNADLQTSDILKRKRESTVDFETFYRGISREKKERYESCHCTDESRLRYIADLTAGIISETGRLKKELEVLKETPPFASDITVVFSLEGMREVQKVYAAYWIYGGKGLREATESSLASLRRLMSPALAAGERKALEIYAEEIMKIQKGGVPVKKMTAINQIIVSAQSP
ncbi:MAG: hypothetical protein PHC33_02040 [Candidatus Omnitrophica bacterium]|nr:hypothetical protein [Candidatus Omnitrophota bacterium]